MFGHKKNVAQAVRSTYVERFPVFISVGDHISACFLVFLSFSKPILE
jgi:hypothetical protein